MVDMELVLENESGIVLLEFFWHRMLLLLQTPGFRKIDFTSKPGSLHVLSCGIAKTLLLCGDDCCILYRIAKLFIRRSVTGMTNWFVLRIICLYLLPSGSHVAEQLCFAVGDQISAVGSSVDDMVVASPSQAAYCQA